MNFLGILGVTGPRCLRGQEVIRVAAHYLTLIPNGVLLIALGARDLGTIHQIYSSVVQTGLAFHFNPSNDTQRTKIILVAPRHRYASVFHVFPHWVYPYATSKVA